MKISHDVRLPYHSHNTRISHKKHQQSKRFSFTRLFSRILACDRQTVYSIRANLNIKDIGGKKRSVSTARVKNLNIKINFAQVYLKLHHSWWLLLLISCLYNKYFFFLILRFTSKITNKTAIFETAEKHISKCDLNNNNFHVVYFSPKIKIRFLWNVKSLILKCQ